VASTRKTFCEQMFVLSKRNILKLSDNESRAMHAWHFLTQAVEIIKTESNYVQWHFIRESNNTCTVHRRSFIATYSLLVGLIEDEVDGVWVSKITYTVTCHAMSNDLNNTLARQIWQERFGFPRTIYDLALVIFCCHFL